MQPPAWYSNIIEDKEFWEWYTTNSAPMPQSAMQTLRNANAGSWDSIVDTLYVWWKMGGKELSGKQVISITKIWLNLP